MPLIVMLALLLAIVVGVVIYAVARGSDDGVAPPFPDSFSGYQLVDDPGSFHVEYANDGDAVYVWLHEVYTLEDASVEFDLVTVGDWECGQGVHSETSCFIDTPHGALETYQYDTPPNEQVHALATEFLEVWLN